LETATPEPLIQLAESVGIVEVDYVNNREEFMKELMDACGCDREDAKTILLLLFTGGFDRWVETRNIDFNKCGYC
jgi:hypothetical protein